MLSYSEFFTSNRTIPVGWRVSAQQRWIEHLSQSLPTSKATAKFPDQDSAGALPKLTPEERQEVRLRRAELDQDDWLDEGC